MGQRREQKTGFRRQRCPAPDSNGPPARSDTKLFTAREGWLHKFGNRFAFHHLTSSWEEGRDCRIRYLERDRDHIHMILLQCIVIFVLLAVVNLLWCLIYKLNFIIGSYVPFRKHIVPTGSTTVSAFRHLLGVLEHVPCEEGGELLHYTLWH